MAVTAEHLGIAQLQAPVGTDVDRDDVVHDLREREEVVRAAVLAETEVEAAS